MTSEELAALDVRVIEKKWTTVEIRFGHGWRSCEEANRIKNELISQGYQVGAAGPVPEQLFAKEVNMFLYKLFREEKK